MEHLVTVGVVLEDEAVQKSVVNALRDKFYGQIEDALCAEYYRYRNPKAALTVLAEHSTEKFLEDHKAEIVAAAASLLVEKLRNTKAVKDMVKGLADEHQ